MPKIDWSLDQPLANIGPALRALRARRGLSRREIGARAGCPVALVGRIERGEQRPSLPRLEALLRALGFHLGDLFVEQLGSAVSEAPAPRSEELWAQLDGLRIQVENLQAAFDGSKPPESVAVRVGDEAQGRKAAEITKRLQGQHDSLSIEPATAGLWESGSTPGRRAQVEEGVQRGRNSSR